jgi:hypothetical protein
MIIHDVISRARDLLHDTTTTYRWSENTLLAWLNDGIRELVNLRPDARFTDDGVYVAPADIVLPSAWVIGTSYVAGDRVTPTAGDIYIYKVRIPGTSGVAEPSFVATEDTDTSDGTVKWRVEKLAVPNQYLGALANYLCYRAYARDSADTSNAGLADAHYKLFRNAIGK